MRIVKTEVTGKTGQHAKVYPTRTNGYENGEAAEFSDQFKATVALKARQ